MCLQFDEEVDEFLGKLDVASLDLANLTFAGKSNFITQENESK